MARAPAIISLEEFTESINMVLYGDSGVGKTVLAGSCPEALFLAVEAGTISAKRRGSTADLWPINSWQDLVEAYEWLEANPDAYQWVIIDSVTQMQKLCMRGILNLATSENKSRDPDIPAIQDWQKYYNMFDRFITAFNALPVNILYTATTMKNEDSEGEVQVMPDVQGPSYAPFRESQKLCASVSVVAYYKKSIEGDSNGEEAVAKRSLLFDGIPPYFAKDRYGVFPRWVKVTEGDKQVTTMEQISRRIMTPPTRSTPAKKAPAKKAPPRRGR